jgi:hypothetical protein
MMMETSKIRDLVQSKRNAVGSGVLEDYLLYDKDEKTGKMICLDCVFDGFGKVEIVEIEGKRLRISEFLIRGYCTETRLECPKCHRKLITCSVH